MDFLLIKNDTYGNPRYVLHFLECEPESWKDYTVDLSSRYARVVKLMNQTGIWGRKYHNKSYGGGIVFSTYNLETLEKRIEEAKRKEDRKVKAKFKELAVGSTFDFINDKEPGFNSFFLRCTKISARCYSYKGVKSNRIGSINCDVYHVKEA